MVQYYAVVNSLQANHYGFSITMLSYPKAGRKCQKFRLIGMEISLKVAFSDFNTLQVVAKAISFLSIFLPAEPLVEVFQSLLYQSSLVQSIF